MNPYYEWRVRSGFMSACWVVSAVCLGVAAATTEDNTFRVIFAIQVPLYLAFIVRERRRRGQPHASHESRGDPVDAAGHGGAGPGR